MSKLPASTRVAFILSHPFQYQFYESTAALLAEPFFVLEHRKSTPFEFSDSFVASLPGVCLRLQESELHILDSLVDVIVCMTPKQLLVPYSKAKTACLQYSLAKESYQYGPWRCVADLNLMQGEYSHQRVDGYAQSVIVGNPRYDNLDISQTGGGGLLYMPTYGELSSMPLFLQALPLLPEDLRIRIKTHHGSEFEDRSVVEAICKDPRVELLDGYSNALPYIAKADVVLSDYSGAIFDALYLDRPVALVQHAPDQSIVRTSEQSLEVCRAADIGPIARSAEEIPAAIFSAISEKERWMESRDKLCSEIFAYRGRSAERVIEVLGELVAGQHPRIPPKGLIGETLIRYIKDNRALRKQLSDSRGKKTRVTASAKGSGRMTSKAALRHLALAPLRISKRLLKSLKHH